MSVLGVYTGGRGKSGLGWGSHLGVLQRWVQDWAGLGWGGAGVEERAASPHLVWGRGCVPVRGSSRSGNGLRVAQHSCPSPTSGRWMELSETVTVTPGEPAAVHPVEGRGGP